MAPDGAARPASSFASPSTDTQRDGRAGHLGALGWKDRWRARFAPHRAEGCEPGRVIRHDGGAVLTALDGPTRQLRLRRSLPPLAVGDWIVAAGDVATDVLERSSLLQRLDPSTGAPQPIAANVDVVMIVCGLDRP